MSKGIDHLIIKSPFTEPQQHRSYEREEQRFIFCQLEAIEDGGFGRWAGAVSFSPSDLPDLLARHGAPQPR